MNKPNDKIPVTAMYPEIARAFARIPEGFPSLLAQEYPRVLEQIETLWGSREAMDCLNQLMFSDRFDRQGFSEQVIAELTLLVQVHQHQFPEVSADPNDPFYRSVVDHCRIDTTLVRKVARNKLGKGAQVGGNPLSPEHSRRAGDVAGDQAAERVHGKGKTAAGWPEISDVQDLRQYCDLRDKRVLLSYPRDQRALGEILVGRGIISREVLDCALRAQKARGGVRKPLGDVLIGMKAASPDDVMRALCVQAGIPMVDLSRFRIARETANLLPAAVARRKRALPIAVVGKVMFLAVDQPFTFAERNYFAVTCNRDVELVYSPANVLSHRLEAYGHALNQVDAGKEFRDLATRAFNGRLPTPAPVAPQPGPAELRDDDATVIGLVNKMIDDAIQMEASDIHIEAFPNNSHSRIRFRRDGSLQSYSEFSSAYHEAVVSRIKIMADLDISERRRPQDGKIAYKRVDGVTADLRVATIPTIRSIEDITIRLLPCGKPMRLEELGMTGRDLERLRTASAKPYGLILVCGPTGSGKTTTLHSVLHELNTDDRKIWTAEDPVEIVQPKVCQVQVNSRIGWTFASALRSFLRADPDVIMIGEMRDIETAKIALEASMTGHLVLSTLHTNSASETAARLIEMGIDPFSLSDALLAVLAQRLAQRLCTGCATATEYSQSELDDLAAEYLHSAHGAQPSSRERAALVHHWRDEFGGGGQLRRWTAPGCEACSGTGFRGRVGLFELSSITPEMRSLVRRQAQGVELQQGAIAGGMRTMKQDGIEKVLRGLIDLRQVRAACI